MVSLMYAHCLGCFVEPTTSFSDFDVSDVLEAVGVSASGFGEEGAELFSGAGREGRAVYAT